MITVEDIKTCVEQFAPEYDVVKVTLLNDFNKEITLLAEFKEQAVSLLVISGFKLDLSDALGASVTILHAPLPQDCGFKINKEVLIYGK